VLLHDGVEVVNAFRDQWGFNARVWHGCGEFGICEPKLGLDLDLGTRNEGIHGRRMHEVCC